MPCVVVRGVARIFQRGEGHTVSNIVMAFSPRKIIGCFLKIKGYKGVGWGGHGHPRTPLATPLVVVMDLVVSRKFILFML